MNEKTKNRIAIRLAAYFLCKNGAFASGCYTGGCDVSIADKLGFTREEMMEFARKLRGRLKKQENVFGIRKMIAKFLSTTNSEREKGE